MKKLIALCACVGLLAGAGVRPAAAHCGINGDISATQTGPNEWTYCVYFNYFSEVAGDSLMRVSLFLPRCQVGCRADLVTFPADAGSLTGMTDMGDTCTVNLAGHFYCDGDPAIHAPPVPTVAWSMTNDATCHPTLPVNGHFCFTLNVPPSQPREQTNSISILSAEGQCWGTLKGVFPDCNPPVPTRSVTWSDIKGSRYAH